MPDQPDKEFGQRQPAVQPPVKRSHHVALLLMGTVAIGSGAYALMPSENCDPDRPAISATPGQPNDCVRRSSSGSGGHGYSSGSSSRSNFFGGDSSSGSTPSGSSSSGSSSSAASDAGHVSRGGFGSFAHAFAAHFSGGG